MPYPFSKPRPTITRDIDESPAVQLRSGGQMIDRMHVTNPSADTVMYFNAWDVLLANLNTGTSRMLFDHAIPAGQTLVIEDLPLENGFTVKCTSAAGAADATAPNAAGVVHDWKME
jgi:hypothetical protein